MVQCRRRSSVTLDHHVAGGWGFMARSALTLAAVGLALSVCLSGCVPSIVSTEHEYILARSQGDALLIVKDDDPLYRQFESEVLSDPYLYRLLMIYEHATEAFLATNVLTPLSQTVANKPVIVLNGPGPAVLRDVELEYGEGRVAVELAMGLGNRGDLDLDSARQDFGRVIASSLVELMGLDPGPGRQAENVRVYETTSPSLAFRVGFQAAVEAFHGQEDPGLLQALRRETPQSAEMRDRLYRYELVPGNGLRFRFDGDVPTTEPLPYEDALRTPGVVATFFYRLIRSTGDFYPQRDMVWFVNFESGETPYAKVLLAVSRMSGDKKASVQAFVRSYIETFPIERSLLLLLVEQVFGGDASRILGN